MTACEIVPKISAQACAREHACAPDIVTQHPIDADTTTYYIPLKTASASECPKTPLSPGCWKSQEVPMGTGVRKEREGWGRRAQRKTRNLAAGSRYVNTVCGVDAIRFDGVIDKGKLR